MLIGYMRVSKGDGSQNLDLQKDALLASGVHEDRIYSDTQSGSRHDDRPGLISCLKALLSMSTKKGPLMRAKKGPRAIKKITSYFPHNLYFSYDNLVP